MSLTSMLKENEDVKRLFGILPDVTPLLKIYRDKDNPYTKYPLVPRIKGSNPSIVGTAYDFWLRAYIQVLNGFNHERNISKQIIYGLMHIEYMCSRQEFIKIKKTIHKAWELRNSYIDGRDVCRNSIVKSCILLAYVEAIYRQRNHGNNIQRINGENFLLIDEKDHRDLSNLIIKTEKNPTLFKTKSRVLLNPTFGKYSVAVGGADADYVLGSVLIDIKTSAYVTYNIKEYFNQLLGYYLLSEFDDNFPIELEHIGIFFPRFNRFMFLKIKDLGHVVDLKLFSQYFKDIIKENRKSMVFKVTKDELENKIVYI